MHAYFDGQTVCLRTTSASQLGWCEVSRLAGGPTPAHTQAPFIPQSCSLPDSVDAPVEKGTQLGSLTVYSGESVLAEIPILAGEAVPRITYGQMLLRVLRMAFLAD